MSATLSASQYCEGVRSGDRRIVAKAITLLESRRADHRNLGQQVLDLLVPHTGNAQRVGITGPPGVGKSTFIETLGLELIGKGHKLAVLAVDPSSPLSGGSILGDKTRMERLSREPAAYIRPTPSGGTLGGVSHRTREAMLVCEAAGHDVVLVETVGVGQSEFEVSSMVDFFCVLLQPGAGDELQGIKKGVLELADALLVNKCDGENRNLAERTRADYAHALTLLSSPSSSWTPRVQSVSAMTGDGVLAFWETVIEHRAALEDSGEREARRRDQATAWLWQLIRDGLEGALRERPGVAERIADLEQAVRAQSVTAPHAAGQLLSAFRTGSD